MTPRLPGDMVDVVRGHGKPSETSNPTEGPENAPSSTTGRDDTPAMVSVALRAARSGLYVFPNHAEAKRPHIKRWSELATTDPEQIRRWWERWPDASPGVALGPSGHVVLDEDTPGELKRAFADLGWPWVETYAVGTGRPGGGTHYWFRQPEGESLRSSGWFKKRGYDIDIKGDGGMAIAVGSKHKSGAVYTALNALSPQPLPAQVVEALRVRELAGADAGGPTTQPDETDEVTQADADRAFENAMRDVAEASEGERNTQLNGRAYRLGRFVGAGLLDEDEVRDALRSAARAAGVPVDEAEATIRSGLQSGIARPRVVTEADDEPDVTDRFPTLDWAEQWQQYRQGEAEVEWVIYPLLPARRLVAIYSAPKVGKSLLMLEHAVTVAQGTAAVPEGSVVRPRVVLYVDFENDPQGDVMARLDAMGYGEADDLSNLRYLSFPVLGGLDTARGAGSLLAAVDHHEAEVVIIDTVSRAVEGGENDNDTWLGFYRLVGLALKQRGVALLRLDHSGKDEARGQRGGSAKVGDVDAVWRLARQGESETRFRLVCEAHRFPVREPRWSLIRESDPLRHEMYPDEQGTPASDGEKFRPTTLMQRLSEFMEDLPEPVTRRHATEGKDGDGQALVRGKAAALRAAWDVLLDEGYLTEDAPGSGLCRSARPYRAADDESPPRSEGASHVPPGGGGRGGRTSGARPGTHGDAYGTRGTRGVQPTLYDDEDTDAEEF